MARSYKFTVPGDPVPKGRPRVGRSRAYTPARTKVHERLIWSCAMQAGVRPIAGPVTVWCDFHVTSPGKSDADNLAKAVLDALNGYAYADDRQVHELNIRKHLAARGEARTDVTIYPCTEVAA